MGIFEYLTLYKAQLELIYLASAPMMLLGLLIAWLQLRSIRKDLKAKYRRESIKEVFNSLNGFNNVATMSYKLDCMLKEEGLLSGAPEMKSFEYSEFPENCDWLKKFEGSKKSYNYSIKYINYVEPMSQRILSGLADEKYAYKIEGSFFMRLIDDHRAVIAAHRSAGNEETFRDSIELYELWRNRRVRQEAGAKLYSEISKFLRMPKSKGRKIIE